MDVDAVIHKIEGLLDLGLIDTAFSEMHALPESAQQGVEARLQRLRMAVMLKVWPEAVQLADSLLDDLPYDAMMWLNRSKALVGVGRLALAREAANQVAKLNPAMRMDMLVDRQLAPLWEG